MNRSIIIFISALVVILNFQNCSPKDQLTLQSSSDLPIKEDNPILGDQRPPANFPGTQIVSTIVFSKTLDGAKNHQLVPNEINFGKLTGFSSQNITACAEHNEIRGCSDLANWQALPNRDWYWQEIDKTWRARFSDLSMYPAGEYTMYVKDKTKNTTLTESFTILQSPNISFSIVFDGPKINQLIKSQTVYGKIVGIGSQNITGCAEHVDIRGCSDSKNWQSLPNDDWYWQSVDKTWRARFTNLAVYPNGAYIMYVKDGSNNINLQTNFTISER